MHKKTIIVIALAIIGTGTIMVAAKFSGINFKKDIDVSGIAAVAALISSAVIFYFGYSQTSKSEQIKIVRDIMDRIGLKFKGLG